MKTGGPETIIETAVRLLQMEPDPVPRLLILRDILTRPASDPDLRNARRSVSQSRWVSELGAEQDVDGSWGRFHSMDSRRRCRIRTTEAGVERALAVGLEPGDEILRRAALYTAGLLRNEILFPDPEEANDRWPAGRQMFVATTLAQINPDHELLPPVYATWREIAERTFQRGAYDPDAEWRAHCELTGALTMRNSYLVINNKYAVFLLACMSVRLPEHTEAALVRWLLEGRFGLGYLGVPLASSLEKVDRNRAAAWFRSQAILSRFQARTSRSDDGVERLWQLRNSDGLWDFGSGPGLRLSQDHRRPRNRTIDHSVNALLLLTARCCSDRQD